MDNLPEVHIARRRRKEGDATERRWYTEPETFIAIAALIVGISAVAVGLYEASLQRYHDRAEVWPHLEIQVFTKQTGADIDLQTTGIGLAIVKSVTVTVEGKPPPATLRTHDHSRRRHHHELDLLPRRLDRPLLLREA